MTKCVHSRRIGLLFENNTKLEIKTEILKHVDQCCDCQHFYKSLKSYNHFIDEHIPYFKLDKESLNGLLYQAEDILKKVRKTKNKKFEGQRLKKLFSFIRKTA